MGYRFKWKYQRKAVPAGEGELIQILVVRVNECWAVLLRDDGLLVTVESSQLELVKFW
jgi:hypothetical protein